MTSGNGAEFQVGDIVALTDSHARRMRISGLGRVLEVGEYLTIRFSDDRRTVRMRPESVIFLSRAAGK